MKQAAAASHRFEPCSAMRRAMSRMAVDAGEGLAAAAVALQRDQAGDRDQHHAGDLRRAAAGSSG